MMRAFVIFAVALTIAGSASADAHDQVDFQRQILPIFQEHCVKCHGQAKPEGRMSLHTADGLQAKWNADKHLLVPGDPEHSELYERITLPADSPKRMPKGADPLPQEKIDRIAAWIRQGAVFAAAEVDSTAAADLHSNDDSQIEQPQLPQVAAAPPEAIARLIAAGARVTPLYDGSSLLDVSFAGRGEPATDADVALLADVAEQVYSLNLASAQVTAAGLSPLESLANLATLHLEMSSVTNDGLPHIAPLERLQYLNLYRTGVTDDGLAHLAGLARLRKLYLWQTQVSYEAAMALEGQIPGLAVNLGYDHPVVARKRLSESLAAATNQLKEATTEAEQAKHQLERAQHELETITARVAELEKQLKALDGPADGS